MASDDSIRQRLAEALEATSAREQELGRDGYLLLPEKLKNQLAVLQAQCVPRETDRDALLGAEHLLKTYNERLDDAFNLVSQLRGEAGRQAELRQRRLTRAFVGGAAALAVGAAGFLFWQREVAAKTASCQRSPACADSGLCTAQLRTTPAWALECRAGSDEHCKASSDCRELGRCSAVDGACVAARDEDCQSLAACASEGRCRAVDGECVAASVEDCRRTPDCTAKGACTPVDGACRPGSDADCRQSELCKRSGACTEVAGECIKPAPGFGKSSQ